MTSEWQAKLLRQSRAAVHDLRKQQIGEDEFNRCEAAKREATEWLWARAEPLATVAKQNGFHFFDCRVGDSSRENMAIIFRFSDGKGSHYICRLSGYKRILKKNDCQLSLADGVDIKVGIYKLWKPLTGRGYESHSLRHIFNNIRAMKPRLKPSHCFARASWTTFE